MLNLPSIVFIESKNLETKALDRSLMSRFNNILVASTLSAAKSKSVVPYTFQILDEIKGKIEPVNTTGGQEPTNIFGSYQIYNKTLKLVCSSGLISTNNNFTQFGLVSLERTENYIHNLYEINCTDWNGFHFSIQDCYGKTECEINFKLHWFKKECQESEYLKDKNGFIKLFCDSK